ncbi:MAG: GNAT family N-acetyltransferase [Myxococcaceae bacterium]
MGSGFFASPDRTMAPAAPRLPLVLTTPTLTLRDLREEDLPDLCVFDADPEVTRYMSNDPTDEAGSRKYLERSLAAGRAIPRSVHDLAITRTGEPTVLGRVGFHIERPEHRYASWPGHQTSMS